MTINLPPRIMEELKVLLENNDPELQKLLDKFNLKKEDLKENKKNE